MTRVAAIDCGTNSIRLLVADVPPEGPHTDLLRRMEVVRLGQGVDATGRLAPEAIERTRVVLAQYAAQARELGATAVRMVATSASRDAANRADFEAMVLATLGQLPDVVPGDEEARLSFLGATASLDESMATAWPPSFGTLRVMEPLYHEAVALLARVKDEKWSRVGENPNKA